MKEVNIFDVVNYNGKAKTVVACSLSMVCLSDLKPPEVKEIDPRKFNYGPWIDKQFLM